MRKWNFDKSYKFGNDAFKLKITVNFRGYNDPGEVNCEADVSREPWIEDEREIIEINWSDWNGCRFRYISQEDIQEFMHAMKPIHIEEPNLEKWLKNLELPVKM